MSQLLQGATRGTAIQVVDGVAAPGIVAQGIPYDGAALAIDLTSPVDHVHMGLPFSANGRLSCEVNSPIYYGSGAAPFSGTGQLCLDSGVATRWSSGIPYGATGGIAVEGLAPFL